MQTYRQWNLCATSETCSTPAALYFKQELQGRTLFFYHLKVEKKGK
jgi:hypothetical protein